MAKTVVSNVFPTLVVLPRPSRKWGRRKVEVRRYMEDYILILAAAFVLGELLFLRRRGEL